MQQKRVLGPQSDRVWFSSREFCKRGRTFLKTACKPAPASMCTFAEPILSCPRAFSSLLITSTLICQPAWKKAYGSTAPVGVSRNAGRQSNTKGLLQQARRKHFAHDNARPGPGFGQIHRVSRHHGDSPG